jgi:monofunctional biosynthetic peptidoglycan transglycosylase
MGESRTPVQTRRFRVAGLGDADAALRVEHALLSVPGVHRAICDFDQQQAIVRVAEYVTDEALSEAVEGAGFTLMLEAEPAPVAQPAPPLLPAPPRAATTDDDLDLQPAPVPVPDFDDTPDPGRRRQTEEDLLDEPSKLRIWLSRIWYYGSRAALYGFAGSIALALLYRVVPVPTTLLMISEGLFSGRPIRNDWVPLTQISPNLVRSVIASEDGEFCTHYGFDFKAMQDAWKESKRGERLRGASTISQQTAKNVFLWPGRSWIRKGLEAYFTVLIETMWPKRRIMEVYLNVIEWGPGVFGAEAAAQKWFGKRASRLTPMEAARLAAILPNPNKYKANPPGPYVNSRSYTISARAYGVGQYGEDRCARP